MRGFRTKVVSLAVTFFLVLGMCPTIAFGEEVSSTPTALVASRASLERVFGETAAETSAAISEAGFESSEWVVIARDDDFADAMSATGLAGSLGAPIVLTDRHGLSASAAEEIARLGATKAYIIGGLGAMPGDFENELSTRGFSQAERIFGTESWDTSVACASKIAIIKQAQGELFDKAIVAMSVNFQDALSISSFAYAYGVPIFLQTAGATAADRSLSTEAQELLEGTWGSAQVYVPGGTGALSEDSVEGVIDRSRVTRMFGETGYDTSAAVAEQLTSEGLLSTEYVSFACGAMAPKGLDALSGSALAGKNKGVILLANANEEMEGTNTTTVEGFFAENVFCVSSVSVLGGAYVMPSRLMDRISDILFNLARLGNFSADETNFVVDSESAITFTVDALNINEPIDLCEGDSVVGTMHDDGLNGDDVAGDNTFTCVTTAASSEATTVSYVAKTDDTNTEIIPVYYFALPTESSRDEALVVQREMQAIEAKYADETGYMPKSKLPDAIQEAAKYAEELQARGVVLLYEITTSSVSLKLSNGLTYAFAPREEGTYRAGNSENMTVSVYQPFYDWVSSISSRPENNFIPLPSTVDNEADLLIDAATEVSTAFDNYSFPPSATHMNGSVSLESVKSFGANQVILWQGHGMWLGPSLHSVIMTGQKFDWSAYLFDVVYFLDCCQNRIVDAGGDEVFSSKYITKYCGDLNNSFVYLGPCQSGYDGILAQSFLDKGAAAVIANSETILCRYGDMMEYTVTHLLTQIDPTSKNYFTLWNALSTAKGWYGASDKKYGGKGAAPFIYGGNDACNYRLADAGNGTVSGTIFKASDDSSPVEGAVVKLYDRYTGTLLTTSESNAEGYYSFDAPEGRYRMQVDADGYIPFEVYVEVVENETTYMEGFLLIQGSSGEIGSAVGTVSDALTGEGLEGVELNVRDGWDNDDADQGVLVTTATTDSDGGYSLDLPLGNYTVCASKDGYIASSFNIIVQGGLTANQNGTLTSSLAGDDLRVVLTWGSSPSDLDSHMVGTLSSGSVFHVYYSHKSQYDGDVQICNLDLDDTSSYGPETVTLNVTAAEPYYYYVHQYSSSGSMIASSAQVKVYQGDSLMATYNVPTDQGDGEYWNVFALVDGKLVVNNVISSSPSTNYAGLTTLSVASEPMVVKG